MFIPELSSRVFKRRKQIHNLWTYLNASTLSSAFYYWNWSTPIVLKWPPVFTKREVSPTQNCSKGDLWSYSMLLAGMDMNHVCTQNQVGFKVTAVPLYWTRFILQLCIPLRFSRLWWGFWNTALEHIRFCGPGTAFSWWHGHSLF